MDVTLASCYDTSAGVGIPGRGKHEVNRMKGLPIYWIAVPILVLAYVLMKAPDVGTKAVMGVLNTGQKSEETPAPSPNNPEGPPSRSNAQSDGPQAQMGGPAAGPLAQGASAKQEPEVFVRSIAVRGNRALVTLTNGQVLTKADGLVAITENHVYASGGRKYSRRGGPPPQPASAGGDGA